MKTRSLVGALALLSASSLPSFAQDTITQSWLCESVDPMVRVKLSVLDTTHQESTLIENIMGKSHTVQSGFVLSMGQDIHLDHAIGLVSKSVADPNLVNFRLHRYANKEHTKLGAFEGFVTVNLANPKISSTLYLNVMRPIELSCETPEKFYLTSTQTFIKARKEALSKSADGKTLKVAGDNSVAELDESLDKMKDAIKRQSDAIKNITGDGMQEENCSEEAPCAKEVQPE